MDGRFRVCEASAIGPAIWRLEVDAPRVAAHTHAGQFVVVRATPSSERIPLTISDRDPRRGTIVLVIQAVGASTSELVSLVPGDRLSDVLGPLGKPTELGPFGHCVVVAGGVGAAIALPVMRSLTTAGNSVTSVLGAKTSDHVILHDEIQAACSRSIVTTEDGSLGVHGLVTDALEDLIARHHVDRVFTVGPIPMMRAVAECTRDSGITTIASLNPIMVDGTGMCGGCRVSVGDTTRFACVDGPEFDAHLVDFDLLQRRNEAYRSFERCRIPSGVGDG